MISLTEKRIMKDEFQKYFKEKNKDNLITRNKINDNLTGFLQSLTMNKYTFKFKEFKEKLEEMQFNKINSFECTVLDFFVFNEFIDDDFMINLNKQIDTKVKQNKLKARYIVWKMLPNISNIMSGDVFIKLKTDYLTNLLW